jgi:Tol biopolymer transport system component
MLTSIGAFSAPNWSPDGRSIVFVSNGEPYTVATAGGLPVHLQHNPAEKVAAAAFSANGEWVYFSGSYKNENEIWRVRAAGGIAERLGGKGAINVIVSTDGRSVFYTKQDATKCTLWTMHADGTQDELAIDSDPAIENARCPEFTLARGGIFYIPGERQDQMSKVMFRDLKRNASRAVLTLNKPFRFTSQGLAVSPDGQTLLYAGYDYQGDLMLIDPFR